MKNSFVANITVHSYEWLWANHVKSPSTVAEFESIASIVKDTTSLQELNKCSWIFAKRNNVQTP